MIRRALTEADAEQFRLIYAALFRVPVERAGNSVSGNVGNLMQHRNVDYLKRPRGSRRIAHGT
jgi:hypothetical protein